MGRKKIVKFEDGTVRRYEVFDDEPNYLGFIIWTGIKLYFIYNFYRISLSEWHDGRPIPCIVGIIITTLLAYLGFRRLLNPIFIFVYKQIKRL